MRSGSYILRYAVSLLICSVLASVQAIAQDGSGGGGSDSIRTESVTGEYVMTKSPTTALLASIVPGGGQLYTEQYWKVPLFLVPAGTFIGLAIRNNSKFNDFSAQADAVGVTDPSYSSLRVQREFYRDQRDLNIAFFLGVYLLGFIDAYVGAHLYDFDVDEELSSFYLYPDFKHRGIGLGVRW